MGQSQGRPIIITDEVKLDHFKLLRVVGKGAFGKVRIVERRDTGLTFALKYIRKDEVVRTENVRNIVRERRMLQHLNHPFLCNLRYSFQDYDYLYLVVDLMSGGDLRFHISRKVFHESAVRFWIAELGCALRYIHKQGVVHRDVKPDNVLLDWEGHVHLADFNVASDLKGDKKLSSKSGTLAYLAPEVYEGKGYRSEVDWWSLGVLFYECIYNKRPFDAHTHDELSAQIRHATPKYPRTDPLLETSCTSAMQALLTRNLHDRIGANGFSNFANHPFFVNAGIDFDLLEAKQVPPVFRPSSEKTNFDATYDLEELLLEEAPLEARTKHTKPRAEPKPDATPQERRAADLYRMIEQLFEPFDYTIASFDPVSSADGEEPADKPRAPLPAGSGHHVPPPPVDKNMMSQSASAATRMGVSRTLSELSVDDVAIGSPPLTSQVSLPGEDVSSSGAADAAHPLPFPRATQSLRGRGGVRSKSVSGGTFQSHSPESLSQAQKDKKEGRRSGFLAFLSTRKIRDASNKKGEPGVIGKGARTIISD